MQFETIETERLLLKKLTPEDFNDLFDHFEEEEICQIIGFPNHEEFLKEKVRVDGGYQTYDRSIVSFFIFTKDTGEGIGRSGFHNWYKDHKRAELGYVIYENRNKNKGYMSEAVTAIIQYGFEKMNLNRIEAFVGPNNEASLKIVRSHEFTEEGHLKQHYVRDGVAEDSLVFGLLKEDYF